MSLNLAMPFLPNMGFQQTNSYGSYASATASSNSGTASAFSSSGSTGLFDGGFNQISNIAGNQGCEQNGFMQIIMQMMQFFMQMMQQMFNGGQQQNNQNTSNNNSLQNTQGQFPFVSPNASANANATATPYGAAANASAGGAYASAQVGGTADNSLLSKVSQKELDLVKGKDLGAVDKNGYPQYLISKAKDGQYHIYEQKGNTKGKTYKCVDKVKQGSNYLHVKDPAKNKEAAASANKNGSFASSLSYNYNPTTGQTSFAGAFAYSDSANSGALENKGGGKTGSPLILDTNKDGKVSAQQGMGVDINGDGKADGAATGGDKMLAMGDIDGDGQITGKEVFGNETVDPFTGQKVNAANGFDALGKVAKSAEQHTGIKCVDENGEVDLQKLKQAMEQSGKGSLGMISGNNTTKLEGLGDASKINTNNYSNHNESGLVQHNQQGSYTDANGQRHSIHDVWFKLS